MSLLRLLTAGKSLVGLKETSRYSISHHRFLPKFASKKNPFRATTKPEQVQDPIASAPVTGTPDVVPPQFPSPKGVRQIDAPGTKADSVAAGSTRRASRIWETVFSWRLKKQKLVLPRFSKPLVQGELSLESVRVVRNDLSDSDLEVVPSKLPEDPSKKNIQGSNPAEETNLKDARQLAGGVVGAGRT